MLTNELLTNVMLYNTIKPLIFIFESPIYNLLFAGLLFLCYKIYNSGYKYKLFKLFHNNNNIKEVTITFDDVYDYQNHYRINSNDVIIKSISAYLDHMQIYSSCNKSNINIDYRKNIIYKYIFPNSDIKCENVIVEYFEFNRSQQQILEKSMILRSENKDYIDKFINNAINYWNMQRTLSQSQIYNICIEKINSDNCKIVWYYVARHVIQNSADYIFFPEKQSLLQNLLWFKNKEKCYSIKNYFSLLLYGFPGT